MDEFIKNLSSPSWWAGVIVVGVILNVFSGYLKTGLDKVLSSISKSWANRSEQSRRKRNEQVEKLRDDIQEQIFLATKEITYRLQAIALIVFCALFFLLKESYFSDLPDAINILFGMILFAGLFAHWEAMQISNLLTDARMEKL